SSGHLVYVDGPQLFAVRFDLDRAAIIGSPWPIMNDVATTLDFTGAFYAISDDGTLIYLRNAAGGRSMIARIDENDRVTPIIDEPGRYMSPRLSPDGRLLAYNKGDGAHFGLWVHDLDSGESTLVRTAEDNALMPLWSRDGRSILHQASIGFSSSNLQ